MGPMPRPPNGYTASNILNGGNLEAMSRYMASNILDEGNLKAT